MSDSYESSKGKWIRWTVAFVAEHWKVLLPLMLAGTLAAGVTTGRVTAPTCPDCPPCFECLNPDDFKAKCIFQVDKCMAIWSDTP